jgi:hypothetical protein
MFNYLSLPYCSMGFSPTLGVMVLVLWSGVLAIWLAATAEFFLWPAVSVLTRLLNMSQQVCSALLLLYYCFTTTAVSVLTRLLNMSQQVCYCFTAALLLLYYYSRLCAHAPRANMSIKAL